MSHRVRAAAFVAAAAFCAALAAASAGGTGDSPQAVGPLREVVVVTEALPARRELDHRRIESSLELRRIPDAFVASDALANPAQALGRRPAVAVPAGAYLVESQLLATREPTASQDHAVEKGHQPVEITVSAAGPIVGEPRHRVDVVVTDEPTTGGRARTYVAARGVQLLSLGPMGDDIAAMSPQPDGVTELSIATLALTRPQALRLIHAQSFAREVRLIGHGR